MDGTKGLNVWMTALIVMASLLVLLFLVCYIMKKRITCKEIWSKRPCKKKEAPT
jgi:uncharacterized membrane protein YozB (DUF420 family)